MAKSVLVTGGAGFVGSHFVDLALAEGYDVTVLDALVPQVHGASASRPRFLPQGVPVIKTDLSDVDALTGALAEADVIVHLAAEVGVGQSMYEIVRYVRGNTLAMAVLLQAMLRVPNHVGKLVVASSMSIYGEGAYSCPNHGTVYPRLRSADQLEQHDWEMRCEICHEAVRPVPTAETKPLYPTSIYAITKRDQEEMALAFGQAYGISAIALRFFNIYGPRQALSNPYTGVAAIFSSRLLNGNSPLIFEDGRQSRDFIHVTDIARAILLAVQTDAVKNDVFNVGTGRPLTILDVATGLARGLGVDVEPMLLGQFRAGDIRHCFADIRRIRQALGFEPKVRFEDGIGELAEWVKGETAVDAVEKAYHELANRGLAK